MPASRNHVCKSSGDIKIGFRHAETDCRKCGKKLSYNGCDIWSKPMYCGECRANMKPDTTLIGGRL